MSGTLITGLSKLWLYGIPLLLALAFLFALPITRKPLPLNWQYRMSMLSVIYAMSPAILYLLSYLVPQTPPFAKLEQFLNWSPFYAIYVTPVGMLIAMAFLVNAHFGKLRNAPTSRKRSSR
jgi:H+/gluconate symporter-like permease